MANPKILGTGAKGQLGKEIAELSARFPQYDFIFFSREDLLVQDEECIKNAFQLNGPQYCINCAAYTAVDKAESEKELAFLVNSEAVGRLAAICREYDCRFIHISTDYVFDGLATTPYKEDSTTNPQSVYGASKLEGEKRALEANPDSIIIRTSWVYSEFGKNFVKTMIKLMGERKDIHVVSDQVGSPTYAADLAEAILSIIVHCELPTGNCIPGVYHFSNEGVISWYDFAVAIGNIISSDCRIHPIPASQYPTPAKRPAYSVLDKTRIRQTFGIRLKNWKQSLNSCILKLEAGRK